MNANPRPESAAASPNDPAVARDASGPYDLLAPLGSGGMGDLFVAARRGLGGFRKVCVVKQMRAALSHDPTLRAMFMREARIAARLDHPNVVFTYDVGEHGGVPYIAMEYLEGQTLRQISEAMERGGVKVDPLLWIRVVSDMLAGLHHTHDLADYDGSPFGIVHRDVSPHNVFVTYEGRVALIDFGSAKATSGLAGGDSGVITGKWRYMAPEAMSGGALDRRADVYSAGVTLWELLAERRMHGGPEQGKWAALPAIETIVTGIHPELAAIVKRALSHDVDQRFASAADMRAALEGYAESSGRALRRDALAQVMSRLFAEEKRRAAAHVSALAGRLEDPAPRRNAAPEAHADAMVPVDVSEVGLRVMPEFLDHRPAPEDRSETGASGVRSFDPQAHLRPSPTSGSFLEPWISSGMNQHSTPAAMATPGRAATRVATQVAFPAPAPVQRPAVATPAPARPAVGAQATVRMQGYMPAPAAAMFPPAVVDQRNLGRAPATPLHEGSRSALLDDTRWVRQSVDTSELMASVNAQRYAIKVLVAFCVLSFAAAMGISLAIGRINF